MIMMRKWSHHKSIISSLGENAVEQNSFFLSPNPYTTDFDEISLVKSSVGTVIE